MVRNDITQREFDEVVLFSLLVDASNILFRDWLPFVDLDKDGSAARRDSFVWSYIATANQVMPLAMVPRRASRAGAECELVLEPPAHLVKALVARFVPDLLEHTKGYDAQLQERRREVDDEAMVSSVAERVAELWTWVGF